ncbi:hypothetical protein ACFQFC_36655 [Amorphoplanes digitatis]|uniref:Uncharacterized protein n=1 Tax=Actinoplanes digitatis TaxID=1868 RepID=A0A7W7MP24_9ACTN|nr:hypothetical protein [Actinoplanes digitatis]MBB4761693.1 hypothetical protein [Actinoplanes digitatis]BFE70282.1 hypothetical protein GCM10020092_035830 [Actinoplanes digitatis]GID90803.1 hypothetical protein Adi01nite_02150 [Actinoplanes digitatis]
MEAIVATGVWLYDGIAPTTVRVVRLDFDFWYAVAEAGGDLEPGEVSGVERGGPAVLRAASAGVAR